MSIGQEVSVTALQMLSAFGAVANGGTLMQPRLVKAEFDAEGREVRRVEPRAVRQVISPETARTLTGLLVQVVEHGTGHAAAIPGYEVGGKTGTAQKLDPATKRYSHAPGVLSFVGVAPADDPRLVMLIMLDEPKNEKWGSEAAAPIFASIGREVLRYLEVAPRDAQPVQLVGTGSQRQVAAERGAGGIRNASIQVEREPATASALMPDLRGKPLRQALATLAALRTDVELEGSGLVIQQVPAAGAPVVPDAPIRLTLAHAAFR
jgi:cell division protein FtsI (penicillin-binding protein 3)